MTTSINTLAASFKQTDLLLCIVLTGLILIWIRQLKWVDNDNTKSAYSPNCMAAVMPVLAAGLGAEVAQPVLDNWLYLASSWRFLFEDRLWHV